MNRSAPVGCAMLLLALALGIGIGLLLPGPTASREPSANRRLTMQELPVTVMRDVAEAIADPNHSETPNSSPAPRLQPDPVPGVERITPRPVRQHGPARHGTASWFGAPEGTAAAGRSLRAFLGRGWRNDRVRVTGPAGTVVVRVDDWMGNPRRLIDLNPSAFTAVCGPLSRGVCRVRVGRA